MLSRSASGSTPALVLMALVLAPPCYDLFAPPTGQSGAGGGGVGLVEGEDRSLISPKPARCSGRVTLRSRWSSSAWSRRAPPRRYSTSSSGWRRSAGCPLTVGPVEPEDRGERHRVTVPSLARTSTRRPGRLRACHSRRIGDRPGSSHEQRPHDRLRRDCDPCPRAVHARHRPVPALRRGRPYSRAWPRHRCLLQPQHGTRSSWHPPVRVRG